MARARSDEAVTRATPRAGVSVPGRPLPVLGATESSRQTAPQAASSPRVIEFSIPAVPMSHNRWQQHWSVRSREDKRWRDLVVLHESHYHPGHVLVPGPVRLMLTFTAPRPIDAWNAARQVENGLKTYKRRIGGKMVTVRHGVIDDDSWDVVTELVLRSRKGEPCTTVRVESVEA